MYDFLLIASVVVWIGVSLAYLRRPAASLFHPASWYLIFHGFVFVIRPLFARWYDYQLVYRVYDFQPSLSDKITVILGANLAMLTFVVVALALAPQPTVPAPADEYRPMRKALTWPILAATALLAPLSIAAQLNNWSLRQNSFDTMLLDPATGAFVNVDGVGWFTDTALMLAPIAVLLLWLARYRWWGWACFGVFAILQSGSGTRGPLIYAVIAIMILILFERRRKWFDWRLVLLLLAAGIAFNQIVADRGGAIRQAVSKERSDYTSSTVELAPLEHMDFANMEYFEYIVFAVPQRTGSWDYFAHNLQIFTEPIPRILWKDKPRGSPVQFFQLWDYGRPIGMTISLPGIGWMSLGYVGIIIHASIFAAIFAWIYKSLLVRRRSVVAQISYALIIAMSLLTFRDGTILTPLRSTPFYLGPLLLVLGIARFAGLGRRPLSLPDGRAPTDGFLELTPAERRQALAQQASVKS